MICNSPWCVWWQDMTVQDDNSECPFVQKWSTYTKVRSCLVSVHPSSIRHMEFTSDNFALAALLTSVPGVGRCRLGKVFPTKLTNPSFATISNGHRSWHSSVSINLVQWSCCWLWTASAVLLQVTQNFCRFLVITSDNTVPLTQVQIHVATGCGCCIIGNCNKWPLSPSACCVSRHRVQYTRCSSSTWLSASHRLPKYFQQGALQLPCSPYGLGFTVRFWTNFRSSQDNSSVLTLLLVCNGTNKIRSDYTHGRSYE